MSEQYKQGMLRDGALEGKTFIVTGGGTGLGKSMATYAAQLGANIVITSRKQPVIDETAAELEKAGSGGVLAVASDVREYDQIVGVIKAATEKFGQVNGLINNAAGNFISPTERLSHRAVNTVLDIVL